MRMLVILAALTLTAAMVGCRASAEVDPDNAATIALPR